ncbi:MAG: valine--tRNA ligase [Candidatus Diapherotrites archaeon]|uniref:Valine--tRNA ligase n=1 Tax=Candidatus Iainarchaeum sp. TaxID=3101447 RepID=A0A2D6M0I3_9ARCH|nr:valine--tRNA ligase [Candidatus Diapherotrites archaeon]|tara:strand:- start:596 stop:2983 length:2388 start_codon:yes stop_codon:yes gene_type:complete
MALDLHEIEQKWQKKWETDKVYKFDEQSKKPPFTIDTPPPTVSGIMHMGHAFAFSQQDFIARYKRMRGFEVFHPMGFDNNGLATALMVEKKLKIRQNDYSREEFVKLVLKHTVGQEKAMEESFRGIGLSFDWDLLYRTIDELAQKTAQYSFLDLHKHERVYQKEAPTMWCPSCGTAVAQAELEDKEVESTFNDIVFKTKDGKEIVIATTRPELLSSCVAVFVHPTDKRYEKLVGQKLKVPLFDIWVPVIKDPRADPEKGTGIVMCCTFGDQTDMEWYMAHSLPMVISIDQHGRMTEQAEKYKGMKIKEARKAIIEDLKEQGLLKEQKPIKHSVNVHERCKTEMEILHTRQWFVKYLELKDEFIVKADAIRWIPKHMKARYDNWVKGLQWDWCISRQRYYGIPFPVWYCKKCHEVAVADEKQLPVNPLKDKPLGKCKCGSNEFEPETDVLDTWFTSSLTPQINGHWAEKTKLFEKIFPMDLRPQGHDIIALWAFNTIVKSLFHQGKMPWKNIMVNGWALDSKGKKMSKSLGNVIAPKEMIDKYSADVLRYWAGLPTIGEDIPFQEKEMVAGKKFLTKLFNATRFVDGASKDLGKVDVKKLKLWPEDKWMLSRLNNLEQGATKAMDKYEFSKVLNPTRNFFWLEFADYYIEMVKHRIYGEENESKKAAQYVLRKVMQDTLLLLAPFVPHITEEIAQTMFKDVFKEKSVHLEKWPEGNKEKVDAKLEETALLAISIIAAIRKDKSGQGRPLNTPVKVATIKVVEPEKVEEWAETIKQTMKIEDIKFEKAEALSIELKF